MVCRITGRATLRALGAPGVPVADRYRAEVMSPAGDGDMVGSLAVPARSRRAARGVRTRGGVGRAHRRHRRLRERGRR
jgi:hypothetical protein